MSEAQPITLMLQEFAGGDKSALDRLMPLVYAELRRLADSYLRRELPGHTLQPTALVHEAWLRLAGRDANVQFANRAHFFAAAADAMRRILIDRARRKSAEKRGGGWERINLDHVEVAIDADDDTLLLVSQALDDLAREEPGAAEIVKLRFFAGLTLEECGQLLGFTERTAKRHWAFARAWLFDAMKTAMK